MDYEVIFTVVNSGYAEDVMDVARKHGARGGTIINARGVVNESAASFFGITMHNEKEIVMIVVPREDKDNILNAVYSEMGMDKKAHGIAFSLPVSDTAGLVKAPVTLTEDEE